MNKNKIIMLITFRRVYTKDGGEQWHSESSAGSCLQGQGRGAGPVFSWWQRRGQRERIRRTKCHRHRHALTPP